MSERIRALIVDDEKLVRQGMMAIMPWSRHGIEVVGDMNSGEKALEFLEHESVNLLITDLAMPVMSGQELIRRVKELYPDVWIVVLTFHQDFELVQEALRQGVIDYILKTQLEMEQMDNVLARIVRRIDNDRQKTLKGRASGGNGRIQRENALLLMGNPASPLQMLNDAALFSRFTVYELENGAWLLDGYDDGQEDCAAELGGRFPDCVVVRVRHMRGQDSAALAKRLSAYRKTRFFYEYSSEKNRYEVLPAELEDTAPPAAEAERALSERWSSLSWVQDGAEFEALLAETQGARMNPDRLESVLYSARKQWERTLLLLGHDNTVAQPENLCHWCDWVAWLLEVRRFIRQKTQKPAYSAEINASILKALDLIDRAGDAGIKQETVARQVCMSRGYFSQCFKDITGKSFNDYVRSVKIEKAKFLLARTNKTVYWIAKQIGYQDEKHFSRVFRGHVGMLPTEYRSKSK